MKKNKQNKQVTKEDMIVTENSKADDHAQCHCHCIVSHSGSTGQFGSNMLAHLPICNLLVVKTF